MKNIIKRNSIKKRGFSLLIAFSNSYLFSKKNIEQIKSDNKIIIIRPLSFYTIFRPLESIINVLKFIKSKILNTNFQPFTCSSSESEFDRYLNNKNLIITQNSIIIKCIFSPKALKKNLKIVFLSFKEIKKLYFLIKGENKTIFFNNLDITSYLLDSFFMRSKLITKIPSKNNIRNLIWFYINILISKIFLNTVDLILREFDIKNIIISHHDYLESGLCADYISYKRKVPIFMVNNYFKTPVKYFKKLGLMNSVHIANMDRIKKDCEKLKEDHLAPYWYNKKSVTASNFYQKSSKNPEAIFVMLHCFGDASYLHSAENRIFNSYYDWTLQTLSFLSKNNQLKAYIRIHPDSEYIYKTQDTHLIEFFDDKFSKFENINFLYPNSSELPNISSFIVTYQGSIAYEMSKIGIKTMVVNPHFCLAKNEALIIPKDKVDYFKILKNFRKYKINIDEECRKELNEYNRKVENTISNYWSSG